MPQIDPNLLSRLAQRLGVDEKSVYPKIQRVANRTMLDRHLAALVLASELGLSFQRYSTQDERAQIRGALGNHAAPSAPATAPRSTSRQSASTKRATRSHQKKDNSIFVVHGRNEALRKSMFDFLRALGLSPREWSHTLQMSRGANPWTLDVIDTAMEKVQAVVVLLTPDDEARLKIEFCTKSEVKSEGKLRGQPRPNVIFEAGLALGSHQEKTLLVQVGDLRGFTDILGKHIPKLTNDLAKRNDLANRLRKIGCNVDTTGDDWHSAGDFTA